ncbi:PREDICTED: uncharacterized protein LOC105143501 [Acromyrmex echinatior]|uniref:uncharacterized protein LOC105143501 n=1 Tax=Acromyrmex echinatior TaxID=103372 RepID=UPI000580D455|nr:PREDICTED: uncharacterized protein LOC105143501 [Acromyrmex echinatior]
MAYLLNKTSILWRSVFHKNIISGPINKNTLVKNYKHLAHKTNAWTEQKYKLKDNISNGYRLVYREHSNICTLIILTYHFGWLSLAANLSVLGYFVCMKPPVQEETENLLPDDKLILRPSSNLGRLLLILGSFTISIILIVGSKTIPFRIYHNSADKIYKAVFVNRILGKTQMETFGESTIVPVFSRNRGDIFFKINGRIVILDKECFPVQSMRERMIHKIE